MKTKAKANLPKRRVRQGDFIDGVKARNDLVKHLQKLLSFFENVKSLDDPGAYGYVAQTFQLLLLKNPVYLSADESRIDPNYLPHMQFLEFDCSGTWDDLDKAMGFNHKRLDAFTKKETVLSNRLWDMIHARQKRELKRRGIAEYQPKQLVFYLMQTGEDQYSRPLDGIDASAFSTVLPDRVFLQVRMNEYSLKWAKPGEPYHLGGQVHVIKASDIPKVELPIPATPVVEKKGGAKR